MPDAAIERSVEIFPGRNENHHPSARLQELIRAPESAEIVRRVFEHIDSEHGIECVARQIETIIVVEIESLDDDARTPAKRIAQPVDVRRLLVGRDNQFAPVEKSRHRSRSSADFEHTLADEGFHAIPDPPVVALELIEAPNRLVSRWLVRRVIEETVL